MFLASAMVDYSKKLVRFFRHQITTTWLSSAEMRSDNYFLPIGSNCRSSAPITATCLAEICDKLVEVYMTLSHNARRMLVRRKKGMLIMVLRHFIAY